jgi:hypothetical protein
MSITVALPFFSEDAWHRLALIEAAHIDKNYAEFLDDLAATESACAGQGYRSKRG